VPIGAIFDVVGASLEITFSGPLLDGVYDPDAISLRHTNARFTSSGGNCTVTGNVAVIDNFQSGGLDIGANTCDYAPPEFSLFASGGAPLAAWSEFPYIDL